MRQALTKELQMWGRHSMAAPSSLFMDSSDWKELRVMQSDVLIERGLHSVAPLIVEGLFGD
jgi:hypothetical protein